MDSRLDFQVPAALAFLNSKGQPNTQPLAPLPRSFKRHAPQNPKTKKPKQKPESHPHASKRGKTRRNHSSAQVGGAHLLALMGESVEGLATGVEDDISAVILCVPSPQLAEVAAITGRTGERGTRF